MTGNQNRSESKASATDAAARDIIAAESDRQHAKTERLRASRLKREAALDEALQKTFPASDPVEVGHSEQVGRPRKRKG